VYAVLNVLQQPALGRSRRGEAEPTQQHRRGGRVDEQREQSDARHMQDDESASTSEAEISVHRESEGESDGAAQPAPADDDRCGQAEAVAEAAEEGQVEEDDCEHDAMGRW
jgi:hypothetical protein